MTDSIQVHIIDSTRSKTVDARLSRTAQVGQLLPALVAKLQLPSNHAYFLIHEQSGKRLADSNTLAGSGVREGDALTVWFEVAAGGGFFVHSFRDVQIIDAYLGNGSNTLEYSGALFAIFLYSKSDAALAGFIRRHFLQLHHDSGSNCYFFVVEQPAAEWLWPVREELEARLAEHPRSFQQVWSRLEENGIWPVESEATVEAIRRRFNVNRSQLPCAIFFNRVDSREVLIVPFERLLGGPLSDLTDEQFLKMFRALFDLTDLATGRPREEWLDTLERAIGSGPVGVPPRAKVYSPIVITTLQETIKFALTAAARALLGL